MKVSISGLRQDSPSRPLLQALISYQGVTDAAGAASGLTIVCGDLVNEPSYDGQLLKVRSGAAAGQVKPIYVQAGNSLTFATPWTNAAGAVVQIPAGTPFDILSISGGGGGPTPAPREGLSYYGVVDAVPGANQFTIGSLAGLGAGKFDGATNPYYAFVLRDAGGAGAAPQGEQLPITAYVTATGVFTTGAFTAAVGVGDEILIIHPAIAATLGGVGKTQVIQIPVTSAANAGDVLLATVTAQDCLIKKVNVRSNGATTANLTNIGIYAGAGKVVTLIDNVTGVRANIAAADQQVGNSPLGGVVLAATKTIVITLTGTGAAAVDLTVTIEYEACVDGGYLT
ncbi:MAG: hypothetical protein PHV11_10310 [Candidatus Bipolaricaulis sp.]|nr:hypothetical protein [Dehalococcoidales bacterium]MDD5220950.1 hypothetical protein [Candidatus Bipolaricaulis sp.]